MHKCAQTFLIVHSKIDKLKDYSNCMGINYSGFQFLTKNI